MKLTAERLRELLSYNPVTGVFVWKGGKVAGTKTKRGYIRIMVLGKNYMAHRLAWLYMYGEFPTKQIDHFDLENANNRIANLRDVTNTINQQNQKSAQVNNKLGILGVKKEKNGRYRARIETSGKLSHLGMFDTPDEAHSAYLMAKRQFHEGCTI